MLVVSTSERVQFDKERFRTDPAMASHVNPNPFPGHSHASGFSHRYLQMKRMKAVLDLDGDGRVGRRELREAAEALGTEDRLQELAEEFPPFHASIPSPKGGPPRRPGDRTPEGEAHESAGAPGEPIAFPPPWGWHRARDLQEADERDGRGPSSS
jgi:hypothetical protein